MVTACLELDDRYRPARRLLIVDEAAHQRRNARVDDALLADTDFVNGRLHVVVDTALGHATEDAERARVGVGVEQRLVTLRRIGHQQKCPTGTQLGMRDQQLARQDTHQQRFFAPVKLERFAQRNLERNKGALTHRRTVHRTFSLTRL